MEQREESEEMDDEEGDEFDKSGASDVEIKRFIEQIRSAKLDEFNFYGHYNEFEGLRKIIDTTLLRDVEKIQRIKTDYEENLNIVKEKVGKDGIPEPFGAIVKNMEDVIALYDDIKELSSIRFSASSLLLRRSAEIIDAVKGMRTSTDFLNATMASVKELSKEKTEMAEKVAKESWSRNETMFMRLLESAEVDRSRFMNAIAQRDALLELIARQYNMPKKELEKAVEKAKADAPNNPYPCPICEQKFETKKVMMAHYSEEHGKKEDEAEKEQVETDNF